MNRFIPSILDQYLKKNYLFNFSIIFQSEKDKIGSPLKKVKIVTTGIRWTSVMSQVACITLIILRRMCMNEPLSMSPAPPWLGRLKRVLFCAAAIETC